MKYALCVGALIFCAVGCSSRSVLPDQKEVKITRSPADAKCKDLGKITGTTISKTPTEEQALEDLKREAAHKGANYVVVQQYSEMGGMVTGLAYDCP